MDINDFIKEKTVPAPEHEAKTINAVLETSFDPEQLRFERAQPCTKCDRIPTILDVVLTGLVVHGRGFVRKDVSDDKNTVMVMDHPFPVTCVNCGTVATFANYKPYVVGPNHGALSPELWDEFKSR